MTPGVYYNYLSFFLFLFVDIDLYGTIPRDSCHMANDNPPYRFFSATPSLFSFRFAWHGTALALGRKEGGHV